MDGQALPRRATRTSSSTKVYPTQRNVRDDTNTLAVLQSYELDGYETSMDFAELKQGLRYSVEVVGRINADDISFDSPPGNAAGTTSKHSNFKYRPVCCL